MYSQSISRVLFIKFTITLRLATVLLNQSSESDKEGYEL